MMTAGSMQVFDEVIRQETIACPERGLFLLRLRDEAKLTLAGYAALAQGANLYGVDAGSRGAPSDVGKAVWSRCRPHKTVTSSDEPCSPLSSSHATPSHQVSRVSPEGDGADKEEEMDELDTEAATEVWELWTSVERLR